MILSEDGLFDDIIVIIVIYFTIKHLSIGTTEIFNFINYIKI